MAARTKVKSTSEKLGDYLDTTPNLHNQDVVTLVGTMTKEENAFYTHLFLKDDRSNRYNPHILCATSGVGNAGIDSSKIGIVDRLGKPESVSDFFQEMEHASRYPNALASENKYVLCFTIEDLIYYFSKGLWIQKKWSLMSSIESAKFLIFYKWPRSWHQISACLFILRQF